MPPKKTSTSKTSTPKTYPKSRTPYVKKATHKTGVNYFEQRAVNKYIEMIMDPLHANSAVNPIGPFAPEGAVPFHMDYRIQFDYDSTTSKGPNFLLRIDPQVFQGAHWNLLEQGSGDITNENVPVWLAHGVTQLQTQTIRTELARQTLEAEYIAGRIDGFHYAFLNDHSGFVDSQVHKVRPLCAGVEIKSYGKLEDRGGMARVSQSIPYRANIAEAFSRVDRTEDLLQGGHYTILPDDISSTEFIDVTRNFITASDADGVSDPRRISRCPMNLFSSKSTMFFDNHAYCVPYIDNPGAAQTYHYCPVVYDFVTNTWKYYSTKRVDLDEDEYNLLAETILSLPTSTICEGMRPFWIFGTTTGETQHYEIRIRMHFETIPYETSVLSTYNAPIVSDRQRQFVERIATAITQSGGSIADAMTQIRATISFDPTLASQFDNLVRHMTGDNPIQDRIVAAGAARMPFQGPGARLGGIYGSLS